MWRVAGGLRFYIIDEAVRDAARAGKKNVDNESSPDRWLGVWPEGYGVEDFVDLGVAVTMCDVFNAREYPDVDS